MRNQAATQRSAVVFVISFLVFTILSKTVEAQPVPTTAQPGIVTRGLQEKSRTPRIQQQDIVTAPKDQQPQGLSTEKAFTLREVILDGTTIYRGQDLSFAYKDMLNQPVSFADLNTIAQRITKKYRDDGYIFSRVVLPPQSVANGSVHLRAIEGRIGVVKLAGKFHDPSGLISDYANKIRSADVANTKEIERYLLLIDDLPGITAKGFIKPSAVTGAGDLIVNIEENFFEGSVGFDRLGSDFIGPYRTTLVGAYNDVFRQHDRTTVRLIGASHQELHYGEIEHEEQIGCEGMKIKTRLAMTGSKPGGAIAAQEIEGDSRLFDLEVDYPLIRSRAYNVNLMAGFNALNSETHVLGLQTADDHVRSLRTGATVDFTDRWRGINQVGVTVSHGIDAFNATEDGLGRSRANGEHSFLKGNLDLTRIQELWGLWSMALTGTAQFSRDTLLSSEEFTVGGPSFGRAYDSGEIAGDRGYSGSGELRYGGPMEYEYVRSYQVYTFMDYGHISNDDAAIGEQPSDSITSAGLGVRFNLAYNFSGYLELNKPLTKIVNSEGDRDSRFFFNVLKRF